ncbi:hypothetical protein [Haloarcula sp. CBA1122]|uniref:hypothetical protein n=1 Tax=Haloarcula sp. CBA1122 TaxID=2668069 RepID=UPI00130A4362|nr:hypothetical protein [Haloarcula sp. CBA1122]MUV50209.1 hypothetical protein [Haloarcula sp. CBA1122]
MRLSKMIEAIPGSVIGVAGVALLYSGAKVTDAIRSGNRRSSDGTFAKNRTTQVDRLLKFAAILVVLVAAAALFNFI